MATLEDRIDRMMQLSIGSELRGRVSQLGARLSNEVLAVRGLSPKEAVRRVELLEREMKALEDSRIVPGHLMADFNQALELYPVLVERYHELQGPFEVGEQLVGLGHEVAFLEGITERDVTGSRAPLLRKWVAGVFQADERLKRAQARRGEMVAPTPSAVELGAVSWSTASALAGVLALSGLVLVGSK